MTSVSKSPLGDSFEGTYKEHVKYKGLRYIKDHLNGKIGFEIA